MATGWGRVEPILSEFAGFGAGIRTGITAVTGTDCDTDPISYDLSVLIPCRNSADVLAEQLEALAAQQFAGRWEVVVADNGSTDATRAVAAAFAERLPGLRVVDASAARGPPPRVQRRRPRASTAAAIVFVDADDVVGPGYSHRHGRPRCAAIPWSRPASITPRSNRLARRGRHRSADRRTRQDGVRVPALRDGREPRVPARGVRARSAASARTPPTARTSTSAGARSSPATRSRSSPTRSCTTGPARPRARCIRQHRNFGHARRVPVPRVPLGGHAAARPAPKRSPTGGP